MSRLTSHWTIPLTKGAACSMRGFEMMPTLSIVPIKKKFAVALRPKDRTGNDNRIEPLRFNCVAHSTTCELVKQRIANDASLADVRAAHLKLRLHQDDQTTRSRKKRHNSGNQHRRRDKARVADGHVKLDRIIRRRKIAR